MRTILSALLISVAAQTPVTRDTALFYGVRQCLAVTDKQQLNEGDRLLILAVGLAATEARAGVIREPVADSACGKPYRAEQPARVSLLSLPEAIQYELFFAVRPAQGLVFIGGPPAKMTSAATDRWVHQVASSLPSAWEAPARLAHAYRYATTDGRTETVELYVGLPVRKRPDNDSIESIVIQRFFIVDGRVLASEQYDRISGREERADTEPPSLTVDNWSASETERTVGFLSKDGGQTWIRLSTDVGFEGIWWIAQALRPGLPRTFEQYLYTHH